MTETAKPAPLAPVFVTWFSASLNQGIANLTFYGQGHDEIGQSPVPVCAASLMFRADDLRALPGIIDDLLTKVGWTGPAPAPPRANPGPPPTLAAPTNAAPPQKPPPMKVRPVTPVFVSSLTTTFIDGVVLITFFAHAESGIGLPPVLIPVFSAAVQAREAKGLAGMIGDLFRQGEMLGKLNEAPTSAMQ
jgi:hypothetical protein